MLSLLAAMLTSVSDPTELVVHEWGTFTCFVDRGSKALPIQIDVAADLPSFVLTRPRFAGVDMDDRMLTSGKHELAARQRMETPVIYFYSEQPTTVDVHVAFPSGLVTEFFPAPAATLPAYTELSAERCGDASISWTGVRILGNNAPAEFPPITEKTHYLAARDTDASPIAITAAGKDVREKFLFYRGMADFETLLHVQPAGDTVLARSTSGPIPYAVMVSVRDDVLQASIARPAAESFAFAPLSATTPDSLAADMVTALVADGLFEREAVSMVNTWKDLWFGEPGTRVLYLLPEGEADRILPLEITPSPARTERVFVGRVEFATEADVTWFTSTVNALNLDDPSPAKVRSAVLPQARARFGRFAAPAIDTLLAR